MELNSELVKYYDDEHTIIALDGNVNHNIFKLSPGLCHSDDIKLYLNNEVLPSSKYKVLFPSSEFRIRYGMDSCAAVMLLDNNINGMIVIRCKPIGGPFANVNLPSVPSYGQLTDYYGHYLEDFGTITGLRAYTRTFENIPSNATDIDGVLVGTVSYAGAGDEEEGDSSLLSRVEELEMHVYHDTNDIPVIRVPESAYFVTDRARPLIQLRTDAPYPTWYYNLGMSQVQIELNPVTGEIMWVDGTVEPGVYSISVYVMSNGVRSANTDIYLNIQ